MVQHSYSFIKIVNEMFSPAAYNFLRYATPIEQGAYAAAPRFAKAALGMGAWAATNYAKNRVRSWGKQRSNPYIKKEVKKAIVQNCPKKWVDGDFNATFTTSNSNVGHIDVVPQGDSCNERVGRTFTIRSMQFKGIVTCGTTQTLPTLCKIVVVLDRECQGALAAYTDLFDTTSPYSLYSKDNAGRFQVLATREFVVSGDGDDPAKQTTFSKVPVNIFIKKNIKITTDITDTTGAIANRRNNAIYYMVTSDNVGVTTAVPAMVGKLRINFTDE